jgi:tRNA (guanine37-N1)-methyltransferase
LGNPLSTGNDSFSENILEYPQYTRPAKYNDWMVPDVLLSGNHARIELWRKRESLIRTYKRRPDLLKMLELSAEDKKILDEIKQDEI